MFQCRKGNPGTSLGAPGLRTQSQIMWMSSMPHKVVCASRLPSESRGIRLATQLVL